MLQIIETYSWKLKQKENWLEGSGVTQTSKEVQEPGSRESKKVEGS